MSGIKAQLASRLRSSSLSTVPPRPDSPSYNSELARAATGILYRTPIPSKENRPIYILNAAALPDSHEADFDSLLPYVLARLPEEEELEHGHEYEVIFFAGDSDGSATTKKHRPGWNWFLQAYYVLTRAMRKRLQKLYIVHEKSWVRILVEIFSTIASPKFRRKITHASTLSDLALHIPIENLLIPPSTYLYDRRISDDIFAPYASGCRAFGARQPLPISKKGRARFPRVLRETTNFILLEQNIGSEGIFRVPAHAKLREVLKEAYDRGQKFIIWKDNGVTLRLPTHPQAQSQDAIVTEVDPRDAYGVYMAAALIKAWYSFLRQPIFPPQSYRDLKRLYGDPDDLPGLERLAELISPSSEWSFLPAVSREIMVRHLLPLLSKVAANHQRNKMTAENLAVCFAPALLRGPDQLEDAKISSVIRRIMTEAIELWDEGLREACGVTETAFADDLRLPEDREDWEDPAERTRGRTDGLEDDGIQTTGVVHQEGYGQEQVPPPLPARPRTSQAPQPSIEAAMRRKPAPPLHIPPSYSTVIANDMAESPSNYHLVADGQRPSQLPEGGPQPDEKKSGTSSAGDSHTSSPTQISLPKRKALTAEQIDNASSAAAHVEVARKVSAMAASGSMMPLPGLANLHIGEFPKRKAVASASASASASPIEPKNHDVLGQSASHADTASKQSVLPTSPDTRQPSNLRRPSWSAAGITSLARPVYPSQNTRNRPPSKSTSLPVPGTKPRTPSPSLLKRMPSFEANKARATLEPRVPQKLSLKKASVDDLRRLYEERTMTAKTLVEAGKRQ